MSPAISAVMVALVAVTQGLPVGTNLGLLHFLWMLVSGRLLTSRGALFPALQALGLSAAAIRRAWAAFRYGAWEIASLVVVWENYVLLQGQWQPSTHDGYTPKAVDVTAFWRPRLKGCSTKPYHSGAGKALPGRPLGLIATVGHVQGQRVALLQEIVPWEAAEPTTATLKERLLQRVAATLQPDEMPVLDADFSPRALQQAEVPRYVVRRPKNITARRNVLPPYAGQGRRPEYGELVRPLPRRYKGKSLPATDPDREETWTEEGLTFRAQFWDNLVDVKVKVHPDHPTYTLAVIHDPRFAEPWVLACPLRLSGSALRGLYRDRWPVEQIPQTAKQMLGAHRQFVFARPSQHRLPELALLAATLLTYEAAVLPPVPTGFWDRQPQPTPGRLRRVLAQGPFPESAPLPKEFRKKNSVTAHLPKGILGHRRHQTPLAGPDPS